MNKDILMAYVIGIPIQLIGFFMVYLETKSLFLAYGIMIFILGNSIFKDFINNTRKKV